MASSSEELLNPIGEIEPLDLPLAPRGADLAGKVVGLLDNMKVNCDVFLDWVEGLLREKAKVREVVRRKKTAGGMREAPPEVLQELVKNCDAVVHGFGD